MQLPIHPEDFVQLGSVILVAVFSGLLTQWLKVFIKRQIETEPGNPNMEGKSDVVILGLVLGLSILTTVIAQCVITWPPTPAALFTAVMVGFVAASLSSFGAKFFLGLFAWVRTPTE